MFAVHTSRPAYVAVRNGRRNPGDTHTVYDAVMASRFDPEAATTFLVKSTHDGPILPDGAVARVKGDLCRLSDHPGKPITLVAEEFEHQHGYSGPGNVMRLEFEGKIVGASSPNRAAVAKECNFKDYTLKVPFLKAHVGDAGFHQAWPIEFDMTEYDDTAVRYIRKVLDRRGRSLPFTATADFSTTTVARTGRRSLVFLPRSLSVRIGQDNWRYFSPTKELPFPLAAPWIGLPVRVYENNGLHLVPLRLRAPPKASSRQAPPPSTPRRREASLALDEGNASFGSLDASPASTVVAANDSPAPVYHKRV